MTWRFVNRGSKFVSPSIQLFYQAVIQCLNNHYHEVIQLKYCEEMHLNLNENMDISHVSLTLV